MVAKPKIGITSDVKEDRIKFNWLKIQYIEAVEKSGGVPIILPIVELDEERIKIYADILDGLLLSGGGDVDPSFYGQRDEGSKRVFRPRDEFEIKLTKFFIQKTEKPLLAICRGHQLLNVALGGTLWQDIQIYWKARNYKVPIIEHRRLGEKFDKARAWHAVEIKKDSKLYNILGKERIIVNSSHHQIVKDLAPGLIVSATSVDGVIETVEIDDDRFVIGVQWHPEDMDDKSAEKLFKAFVSSASKVSG